MDYGVLKRNVTPLTVTVYVVAAFFCFYPQFFMNYFLIFLSFLSLFSSKRFARTVSLSSVNGLGQQDVIIPDVLVCFTV